MLLEKSQIFKKITDFVKPTPVPTISHFWASALSYRWYIFENWYLDNLRKLVHEMWYPQQIEFERCCMNYYQLIDKNGMNSSLMK